MNDCFIVPLAILTFSYVALIVLISYVSIYITNEIQAHYNAIKINKEYLLMLVLCAVSLISYLGIFVLPKYLFDIIF